MAKKTLYQSEIKEHFPDEIYHALMDTDCAYLLEEELAECEDDQKARSMIAEGFAQCEMDDFGSAPDGAIVATYKLVSIQRVKAGKKKLVDR